VVVVTRQTAICATRLPAVFLGSCRPPASSLLNPDLVTTPPLVAAPVRRPPTASGAVFRCARITLHVSRPGYFVPRGDGASVRCSALGIHTFTPPPHLLRTVVTYPLVVPRRGPGVGWLPLLPCFPLADRVPLHLTHPGSSPPSDLPNIIPRACLHHGKNFVFHTRLGGRMHGGNHRSSSWLLHVPFHSHRPPPPSRVTYTHIPLPALSGSLPCPAPSRPTFTGPRPILSSPS
jgi:hypothetical protein